MEILVKRVIRTDRSTTGKLFINGVYQCLTLEDKDRDLVSTQPADQIAKIKVFGKTAIPLGRYRTILSFSNRFQKVLPELVNVPGFAGIRIHPGNDAGDTEGCLLVGRTLSKDFIGESKIAFASLMEILQIAAKTQLIYITIE